MEKVGTSVAHNDQASRILESMATGYFALDADDVITYINAQGENILGLTRAELLGRVIWELFPEAESLEFGNYFRKARVTGERQHFEAWAPRIQAWLELQVDPVGQTLSVYLLDVSARHDAAARVAEANERLALIADAATELAGTFDVNAAVGRLARLIVPQLGDCSLVTLVNDDGTLSDLGHAHSDPELEPVLARFAEVRLDSLGPDSFLMRVAASGVAEIVNDGAFVTVGQMLVPGEALDLFQKIAPACMAIFPMLGRGRTVGLITIYSQTPFDQERLEIAATVAERAGLAIDNARAYAQAQVAQSNAEVAARRMRLLGDVSELLSASLDEGVGVMELAELVVPELADWCIVTTLALDDVPHDSGVRDGGRAQLGWAHRDPAMVEILGRYAEQQHQAITTDSPISICLRTGKPVIVEHVLDNQLDGWSDISSGKRDLALLAPGSVAVLPLKAAGRSLGAIALVTLRERGPQSSEELEIAHEVARRAGLALDNARLYGQQRRLAETLQRSLLSDPPVVEGIEVAVRYVPAAAEAQVGGDWYDAYLQADHEMILAIGDVIGHDTRAAAAMGQVRGLLRGIGYTTGAGPAALLTRLDETIEGLQVGTSATAVVVRLEGGAFPERLRWSNAGHPPPMLVTSAGQVTILERAEADLLLGIDATVHRTESVTTVDPGSTLFLYTDGLVERRGVTLDDGLAVLAQALGDFAGEPLQKLCDLVINRLLPAEAEDDVALIAMRVRPPT